MWHRRDITNQTPSDVRMPVMKTTIRVDPADGKQLKYRQTVLLRVNKRNPK